MSEGTRDRCHYCSKLIRYKVNARPRKYCNDACRQKAYRLRNRLEQIPESARVQLEVWQAIWNEAEYPDALVEQLTAILHTYGHDALMKVQAALIVHGDWKVRQTAQLLTQQTAEQN